MEKFCLWKKWEILELLVASLKLHWTVNISPVNLGKKNHHFKKRVVRFSKKKKTLIIFEMVHLIYILTGICYFLGTSNNRLINF